MADQRQQPRRFGAIRIGRVVGVPIYVNWSWFVIALLIAFWAGPDLVENVPGIGNLAYLVGFGFAVLLYGSVLLHEISHVLVAKAYGLPVRAVTLQLLGGVSEIEQEPKSPWREFAVAAVGPLTSLAISGAGFLLWTQVNEPPVLVILVQGLAWANLVVGVFNLLPGLPLDGGRMLRAVVWGVSRRPHVGTLIAAWAGRLFALGVAALPWILLATGRASSPDLLMIAWCILIAAFLWAGSTQALVSSRIRKKLPKLQARSLARRGFPVTANVTLADAMRQAQAAEAGAVVVVDEENRPSALVSEAAVLKTPEHRRPWVAVRDVARAVEPGMVLSADLIGEDLVRAMGGMPATEYLVIEDDGSVYGVLVTTDVDGAFSRA